MARTAVMTGATGRIGTDAVKKMAAMGINVVMVTHNQQAADELSKACADLPGEVVAMSNDGGDDAVFDDVFARFGSVDIIIPNQGGPEHVNDILDIDPEKVEREFSHQVVNSFKMIKRAVPFLEKSSAGRIILMTSEGAFTGDNDFGFERSVANGGMTAMMKYLATALADKGITVNCIAKGRMEPDHLHEGETFTMECPEVPLGRKGSSMDFANAVAFLASEESDYITGQTIFLTGGSIRI